MKDTQFIVGLGEVLWDKFQKDGKPVRKGKKLGGAPANFAYHSSQFSHKGLIVSAIRLDKDGRNHRPAGIPPSDQNEQKEEVIFSSFHNVLHSKVT